MGMGIFEGIWAWLFHASYDETTVADWAAGFVIVLILAFLWSTVVNHTLREI